MNEIRKATNEILWSLWSELGVPGGGRNHSHLLADPEPLIAFTPHLASADSRLLGLVFDWCVAHANLLSKSRIKAIARTSSKEAQHALARFNGALLHHGVRWSPVGEPGSFDTDRRVVALPIERPSLLRLRLRSLVGASARAEVLTELLVAGQRTLSADELTAAGTTRRSTDRVIAELVRGNFLAVHGKQRGRKFALSNRRAFISLLGHDTVEPPCSPMDWHRLLHAVWHINTLQRFAGLSESLRRVEAVKVRNALAQYMKALHQGEPPIVGGQEDAFEQTTRWSTTRIGEWARGESLP
jgi:hypothetical protein